MTLEQVQARDSNLAEYGSLSRSRRPFFRSHPELWVAIVLWLASNAFVAVFSKFATWEGAASYYRIGDLCRWDCAWFGRVLENGYDTYPRSNSTANWLFHPGQPLLAYPLHYWLNIPLTTSLVLASKIALLLAIYGFLLMVRDKGDSTVDRFRAGSLVAFNPYVIYAHAGYSEPLYFALFVFGFYFISRKWWVSSGTMGAFLSASRMVGFLFAVPYAITALRRNGWRKTHRAKLIGLLLCPLGTALYMLYLYHHTGDALAQVHIHVAWVGTSIGNPFQALWVALLYHHWPRFWAVMSLVGLAASAWLFKLRKPELGTYLALSILIALSGGSLGGRLYGMPRYIWWQPPLLFAIYCALQRHTSWWSIYIAFSSGMAVFMIWGWFSGHNFVV